MSIGVALVSYNRPKLLEKVLRAICAQTYEIDQVWVVDNNSDDATLLVLDQWAEMGVNVIRLVDNIGGAGGFAKAIQIATESKCDWLWLLDDDACPESDALECLVNGVNDLPDNTGGAFSAVYEFGQIATSHRRQFNLCTGFEYEINSARYSDERVEVDTGSFVGMLLKCDLVKVLGLPNDKLFLSYDDTDYSLRIKALGKSLWLIPSSHVRHLRVESSRLRNSSFGLKHYYNIRNRIAIISQHSKLPWVAVLYSTIYGVLLWIRSPQSLNKRSMKLMMASVRDGVMLNLGKYIEK